MSVNIVPAALPPVVYHYTSLSAMMDILQTQKIWASDIAYLNDVSERQLLLSLVDKALPAFVAERTDVDAIPFTTENAFLTDSPFVTSFSGERDALNQWRSYCPVANGVCIGFKTECLQNAYLQWEPVAPARTRSAWAAIQACQFKAVSYIEPAQVGVAEMTLETAYTSALKTVEDIQRDNPEEMLPVEPYFRHYVEAEASFYKHRGFESELEYRLVLPDVFMQTHLIKFRCTRSSMVPYVSLSIPHSNSAELISAGVHRWDAVAEVMIGPTPNIALTRNAVWKFFRAIGLTSANLSESKIPYRDW